MTPLTYVPVDEYDSELVFERARKTTIPVTRPEEHLTGALQAYF
jgi:hypothetical protein